jgi:hypothetical protein
MAYPRKERLDDLVKKFDDFFSDVGLCVDICTKDGMITLSAFEEEQTAVFIQDFIKSMNAGILDPIYDYIMIEICDKKRGKPFWKFPITENALRKCPCENNNVISCMRTIINIDNYSEFRKFGNESHSSSGVTMPPSEYKEYPLAIDNSTIETGGISMTVIKACIVGKVVSDEVTNKETGESISGYNNYIFNMRMEIKKLLDLLVILNN